jgi:SAM-dependent methyltransferase
MAGAPAPVLAFMHRCSRGVRRYVSRDDYIRSLRHHDYVFYNLERGVPLDSNVADYVYSSHVLEHFHQEDAARLIADMYRVLKPGGIVRVCVPDLEIAVRLYQQGHKHQALAYFFAPSWYDLFAQHHYMYDYELLTELLRTQGFVAIRRCQYREGATPDLDKLDNRPEETLYVEAEKPH